MDLRKPWLEALKAARIEDFTTYAIAQLLISQ